MTEYIEREKVKAEFRKNFAYGQNENFAKWLERVACEIVDKIPVADAQPIRRGRWIDIHEYCKMNGYIPSGVAIYYWCSECMKEQEKTSDFCPCCGADMRSPEPIKG